MATRDTYTKVHEEWKDRPDETTPVMAADLEHIEQGIKDAADKRALKEIYDDNAINLGRKGKTTVGYHSTAEGYDTISSGYASHTEGFETTASGDESHAEGIGTKATGTTSHAEGYYTEASGAYSHTEGERTIADGGYSHAEGYETLATANCSHAEGRTSKAVSNSSHAEGDGTLASGERSHAEGFETIASAQECHAEGYSSKAISRYSHAEGYSCVAGSYSYLDSNCSHAEGHETIAQGIACHAEGYNTVAGENPSATGAHAEGYHTTATNNYSHAEGNNSQAVGVCSHAEGEGTVAGGQAQHVQGKYNVYDSNNQYAHIVGGGTSEERKNIHTLDWAGNAYFAGDVTNGAGNSLNSLKSDIDNLQTIAEGGAIAKVFDTKEDLDTWLAIEGNPDTLSVGQNIYIKAADTPDYWWDGTGLQVLETDKVEIESMTYDETMAILNAAAEEVA